MLHCIYTCHPHLPYLVLFCLSHHNGFLQDQDPFVSHKLSQWPLFCWAIIFLLLLVFLIFFSLASLSFFFSSNFLLEARLRGVRGASVWVTVSTGRVSASLASLSILGPHLRPIANLDAIVILVAWIWWIASLIPKTMRPVNVDQT